MNLVAQHFHRVSERELKVTFTLLKDKILGYKVKNVKTVITLPQFKP